MQFYFFFLLNNCYYLVTQSRTAVGRPIAAAPTNTGTTQKYVLMSQRPIAQVNFTSYFYNLKMMIIKHFISE